MADVERIKEYILAGDVMQVVLSQRMSMSIQADSLDVLRVDVLAASFSVR